MQGGLAFVRRLDTPGESSDPYVPCTRVKVCIRWKITVQDLIDLVLQLDVEDVEKSRFTREISKERTFSQACSSGDSGRRCLRSALCNFSHCCTEKGLSLFLIFFPRHDVMLNVPARRTKHPGKARRQALTPSCSRTFQVGISRQ